MARTILMVLTTIMAWTASAGQVALPVSQAFSISSGESWTLSMKLAEGEYIRGQVSADRPFTALVADAEGTPVRQLTSPGASEAFIHFSAPRQGKYELVLKAAYEVSGQLDLARVESRQPDESPQPELLSARVRDAQEQLDQSMAEDDVWRQLTDGGTPLVERPEQVPEAGLAPDERLVTFLWRGARDRVLLFGAPGYEHDPLYRLGDSNLWYRSYRLPADTRMSYQLAPDVPWVKRTARDQRVAIMATRQQDPANPRSWSPEGVEDIYNTLSILELENAPSAALTEGERELPAPRRFRLYSERLGNTRDVDILVSEGLEPVPGAVVPLAIFFDGHDYQSKVPTPRILDNLIRAGRIPPVMAVFVSNPSRKARTTELPCNADFADFMVEELLPFVERQTGLAFTGEQTLLAGASFGGLAAACVAYHHSEHFGLVLSQSGSFWWSPQGDDRPEWLNARYAQSPRLPIRFYLSAGRFETDFGESGILNATRQLDQILTLKGYDVHMDEFSAGHDYFHWRATLGLGLEHLLGPLTSR